MRAALGSTFAFVAMAALLVAPVSAQSKAAVVGAQVVDIPAAYREHTGFAGQGAFVIRVVPDSPAERARIVPGDVLTSFAETAVTGAAQFHALTSHAAAGTPATVELERYGHAIRTAVVPVDVDALFGSPQPCRVSEANASISASIAAGRRHDPETESAAAERALNLYESCAAVNGTLDGRILVKSGDALLLQAAARIAQRRRDAALPPAGNARALYRLATQSKAVPAADKATAQGKIAALERAFPALRNAPADDSIGLGMCLLADAQTVSPFVILATWSSPANDTYTTLHIRVGLHPEQEVHVFAEGFRITIASRYIGDQFVYALRGDPASANAGAEKHAKSDVDPREDFRAVGRVDLGPGETGTYVLTFLVPSDSEYSNAAATIQYAPQ